MFSGHPNLSQYTGFICNAGIYSLMKYRQQKSFKYKHFYLFSFFDEALPLTVQRINGTCMRELPPPYSQASMETSTNLLSVGE